MFSVCIHYDVVQYFKFNASSATCIVLAIKAWNGIIAEKGCSKFSKISAANDLDVGWIYYPAQCFKRLENIVGWCDIVLLARWVSAACLLFSAPHTANWQGGESPHISMTTGDHQDISEPASFK